MSFKSITKWTLLAGASIVSAQNNRPNILYIFTDQQTAEALSCAGNPDVKTPSMDRLAKEGVRFDNAYCACPLSTPSRSSMMTGATPAQLNIQANNTPLNEPFASQTLGNLLNNAGYDCVYAGKWHAPEASIPDGKYGFKRLHEHNDLGLAEKCVSYLSTRTNSRKPFFLVASFDNPHNICEYARHQNLPFAKLEEPLLEKCPNLPANFNVNPFDASVIKVEKRANFGFYPTENYSLEDWRRYRNAYYRLIEVVDAEIGKIVDELDKQKLWDNTVIIFSSDHGDGNAAHHWNQKIALYEEVVHIPFIIHVPGLKEKGSVNHQLVNNGVDFFATVCSYAHVPLPDYCYGKSLKGLLEGKTTLLNEYVVSETLFSANGAFGYMVRTKDFKYICYDKGLYREQLYNLINDRGEMVNLAVEGQYLSEVQSHRDLLKKWLKIHAPANQRIIPN